MSTVVPPPQPAPAGPSGAARPAPPTASLVDLTFGQLWTDRGVPARRGVLLACLGIGLFAAIALPFEQPGLATSLVLLASGGLVVGLSRHRRAAFTIACAALCVGFAVVVSVRDADWLVVLGLMTSAVLTTTALTRGRSVVGMVLGALAWPFAGLRGLPWLGRTLRAFGGGTNTAAVARTTALSVLGVLVFGVLFASADAVFGSWVAAVVPDVQGSLVLRLFLMLAVAGVVLAAAYLALNPPTTEGPVVRRPAQHRFEWLAPVLLVDAVFVLFLAAQAAAFFGGHDYVRSVTGLTYADYVHQGFAQLTVATALTLLVVWAASRKARLDHAADRWWLRASLGGLCVLTLVVVASALHRMDLYQDAYGFTRLRLLVDVFEGWLGLVVLGVLLAGIGLRGWWLPRMALLGGATMLLGLAVANPDAWIARHNLERYEATGKVDWAYLGGLSADATPVVVDALREDADIACALPVAVPSPDGWAGWNLARSRARDLREEVDGSPRDTSCATVVVPLE